MCINAGSWWTRVHYFLILLQQKLSCLYLNTETNKIARNLQPQWRLNISNSNKNAFNDYKQSNLNETTDDVEISWSTMLNYTELFHGIPRNGQSRNGLFNQFITVQIYTVLAIWHYFIKWNLDIIYKYFRYKQIW